MKKTIIEVNNYITNNPFEKRESFRNRFIRFIFLHYIQARMLFMKVFPLKDWQKDMWIDDRKFTLDMPDNSPSIYGDNVIADSPKFRIRHLTIAELIPKEQINDLVKGVRWFEHEHAKFATIHNFKQAEDYFSKFYSGSAFSLLENIRIDENSDLSLYISQIEFKLINLTDSFCCLNIKIFLAKQLCDDIESFVTSNVDEKECVSGLSDIKWYKFPRLSFETVRNNKAEVFEQIITDIKWRVTNEMDRYIFGMVLQSHRICHPSVCCITTNIDGNANSAFWRSLDIYNQLCDYSKNLSMCIAWRDNHKTQLFIRKPTKDQDDWKNEIQTIHIADRLCGFLISDTIDKHIRNQLSIYSMEIGENRKKKIDYWLKLKVRMDTNLFYFIRFLNECNDSLVDQEFDEFISLRENHLPIVKSLYSGTTDEVRRTKKLYDDICHLFQTNIEYRSNKDSHRMRRIALLVSILSMGVALTAVILTILATPSLVNDFLPILNWIMQYKVVIVLLVVVIIVVNRIRMRV